MKIDGGATIETYTGLQFHILEPHPEEVNITDIAHALSMQCRFTGHTRFYYSVAQHSYLASFLVPPQFQLEALLHDASEAYIGDMSRPLKHFSECGRLYLEIEAKIEAVIKKKFGLPPTMSPEVKEADNSLLYAEKNALMEPCDWTHTWGKYEEIDATIQPWEPQYAETQFLRRYRQLSSYNYTRSDKCIVII